MSEPQDTNEAAGGRSDSTAVLGDYNPLTPAFEAMRKDAERYRWLRNRDLDSIVEGGIFAGKVPDNLVINGEDLDMEIDAAMFEVPNA